MDMPLHLFVRARETLGNRYRTKDDEAYLNASYQLLSWLAGQRHGDGSKEPIVGEDIDADTARYVCSIVTVLLTADGNRSTIVGVRIEMFLAKHKLITGPILAPLAEGRTP